MKEGRTGSAGRGDIPLIAWQWHGSKWLLHTDNTHAHWMTTIRWASGVKSRIWSCKFTVSLTGKQNKNTNSKKQNKTKKTPATWNGKKTRNCCCETGAGFFLETKESSRTAHANKETSRAAHHAHERDVESRSRGPLSRGPHAASPLTDWFTPSLGNWHLLIGRFSALLPYRPSPWTVYLQTDWDNDRSTQWLLQFSSVCLFTNWQSWCLTDSLAQTVSLLHQLSGWPAWLISRLACWLMTVIVFPGFHT